MNKMKFKRFISLLMAAVICLSSFAGLNLMTTFAATGEKTEVYLVSYPREGDSNFNENWGHGDLSYMNGWSSHATDRITLRALGSFSGKIAYCIEPGTSQETGDILNEKGENFFNENSSNFNKTISGEDVNLLIGRILEYGYCGNVSVDWRSQNDSDADKMAYAMATQYLIWETIVGERNADFDHVDTGSCNAVLDAMSSNHPLYGKVMSYYNSISSSVKKHCKIPSFCSKTASKTFELEWDGEKYSATLTDENGVLDNYSFSADSENVNFTVSGNKLTVSTDSILTAPVTITASKNKSVRRGVIVWSDEKYKPGYGVQDIISYAQEIDDNIQGFFNVGVSHGSCRIIKTSEDGIVDGVEFEISGNGINKTVKTSDGGKIQLDDLAVGTYTIKELVSEVYVPQETKTITVGAGQTAEVKFNNSLKRGKLKVTKSADDGLVEGVKFHLFGKSMSGAEINEYAVTDENGIAVFENILISGNTPYTLEEVDTAERYIVPAKQKTAINWNEVTEKSFENKLIYGFVCGFKVDENDTPVSGALIGIFRTDETEYTAESAYMTAVTDENGVFYFDEIPYGKWKVREIQQPTGYVLNDTVYEVDIAEYEQIIKIRIVDKNIRGNITLTKVDAEYPENKLAGAIFEIYKDVNENGVIDECDEIIGDLEETETGVYKMNGLVYGKYLVKETKAPEGFMLDEGVYSVNIENDGEVYSVENKAGVGFINNAIKGCLKIVKTSSDGKVEGFSFRVTGSNGYDMTFETDKNGEIVIDGLRIGEYKISEVSNKASAAYILPADKEATVKADSITTVEMHNEVRETPKTGDNRKIVMWYVLAVLSAIGMGTVWFRYRKKK